MRKFFLLSLLISLSLGISAQSFELSGVTETFRGTIGETIKAPLRLKNTSEKPITLIIRKLSQQIGSTQKNFFCIDNNCLEEKIDDYIVRLEPGQTISNVQIGLEGGLVPGVSNVRYLIINRSNPTHSMEFDLNFAVEERPEKNNIYHSKAITVKDVYPNPAVDHAFVDYHLYNDRTKAKIRVHNILGNVIGEYELSAFETLIRIKTEDLTAGIYFYTLYVDNESVLTRKLIVKK
jgi:hypothetical protein